MKNKSTSQTALKRSWKNTILLAITALALFASPGVAYSTVTGNGTTTSVTVEGTLAPNWTLTINGDLTFVGITGPLMQCNVTPDNLGSVDADVSGTATLTGRVSVTMTGTFTPGTQFTLLHTDLGRGTSKFSSQSINFPTGQGFTPKIIYDTNNVYLYLVPNT